MCTYEASDYVRVSVIYVHVFIVEGTLQRGHRRGIPTSETRRKCQWVDREWYEEFKSDNYEEPGWAVPEFLWQPSITITRGPKEIHVEYTTSRPPTAPRRNLNVKRIRGRLKK